MRLEVGCNGKQLLLLVIVSIAAAIFVSSDNPPSQYNIEGFVFDADGNAAATGTTISLPQPDGGITVVEGVNISLNDHPTLGVPALNDTSPTANADIRATVSYS